MGDWVEVKEKKPAVRLWLVGGLLIVAGIVGRVVLHDAATPGPGYVYIIAFQQAFYTVGLIVLGFWVLAERRQTPTPTAVVVWLAAAVLCVFLTCGSSPR
jgi:uncharacterized membrane protein YfbV (UPF0208 family)